MDVIVKATPTAANTRMTLAEYLAARPTAVAIGWAPGVDLELSPTALAEIVEASAASFIAAADAADFMAADAAVVKVVGTTAAPAAADAARPAGAAAVHWIVAFGVVPLNAALGDTVVTLPA